MPKKTSSPSQVSDDELNSILKKTSKKKKGVESVEPHSITPEDVPPAIPDVQDIPFLDLKPEKVKPDTPISEIKKKPSTKISKKEAEKILTAAKKPLPASRELHPPLAPMVVPNDPYLEYVLKTHTKFDLNWYFIKEKFVGLKRWIFSPWRMYCNWWNKKFNSGTVVAEEVVPVDLEDLFEDLKKQEAEELGWKILNRDSKAQIPVIEKDISMAEIEDIFDAIKPALIQKIYDDVNLRVREKTQEKVIKGLQNE